MVVAGPLLWLAGIAAAADAAYASLAPGDRNGAYFVSNYDSPARAMTAFLALINLALLGVLMPTARQLATRRTGTYVRAIVTSLLALGLAGLEHRANPVGTNWGGDPDAWSIVKRHLPAWFDGASTLWILAVAATASMTILLAAAAMVGARQSPQPETNTPTTARP